MLELVSASLGNRDIAHRLGISEGTVKAHLKRIFAVLGTSSRTEAAVWARKCGLFRPP